MWGFLIQIGSWILHGLHVAADLALTWIVPTVKWLFNGAISTGKLIGKFGRRVWGVFRSTWDHVLRPAWEKFDRFVVRVHDWLERHLAPLLEKVNALRKKINGWWQKYVQPFITFLDVARAFARVLAQLGIDWARKLDQQLAGIQSWINQWIVEFNRRLNEAADWINLVIDEGGLFQRIVLLRSIARDAHAAWDVLVGAKSKAVTGAQSEALKSAVKGKRLPQVQADLALYLRTGSGDLAATVDGAAAAWRGYLGVG